MTTNPPTQAQAAVQNDAGEDKSKDISFKWLILLLALVAACLNGLYFMNFNNGWGNQADFGAFGDFLGGVLNPVLGFATVGLLIWSLKMQMEELSLSRKELALTRQELAETKDETALSRQAMEDQVTHLQKEAQLNEVMRIMTDLRIQYQNHLRSSQFINESILKVLTKIPQSVRPTSSYLKKLTINNLLYENGDWSAHKLENLKDRLRDSYHESKRYDTACQFRELEITLIQFSNLILKYHELSNSPELATIYVEQAKKMLQPFQDVFWTDPIAVQLRLINGILHQSELN
ncbi:hypothetical protein L2755_02250 [Shewanella abyssi]|uniref:hypothetical protein n=1 Tax=Shewanella abyssi TaxID=311789 RepID=UPI00200F7AEF|nr:hypothetical protein [Shewanella abyssi]MCL1048455.1 hypothetical protein [Shewanella abyssi]